MWAVDGRFQILVIVVVSNGERSMFGHVAE